MNLMIESIVAGINSLRISVLSTAIQYLLNDAKSFLYSCGRVVFPFFVSLPFLRLAGAIYFARIMHSHNSSFSTPVFRLGVSFPSLGTAKSRCWLCWYQSRSRSCVGATGSHSERRRKYYRIKNLHDFNLFGNISDRHRDLRHFLPIT